MRARILGAVGGGLFVVGAVFAGCSGDSTNKGGGAGGTAAAEGGTQSCPAGVTQCVDDRVLLVCPSDGSGWTTYGCDGACSSGTCSGACTPDARECVSTELARVCPPDGSAWLPIACAMGEVCDGGSCEAAEACTAGTRECASDSVIKACDADGTGSHYEACLPGFTCDAGNCVPDTTAVCVPGTGFCSAATTAWKCNIDGVGYVQTDCPTGSTCAGGQCVGSGCIVGAERCAQGFGPTGPSIAIETCEDGTAWVSTSCKSTESCVQIVDAAQQVLDAYCTPAACPYGMTACGDPSDTIVSDTEYYSSCDLRPDGTLGWVHHQCTAPASCISGGPFGPGASCAAGCDAGAERCSSDGFGIETCDANGGWGAAVACSADGSLACMTKPGQQSGQLAEMVCGDPACVAVGFFGGGYDQKGTCSGSQIRECGPDGRLSATAVDCMQGTCGSIPAPIVINPPPGACISECQAGEEICVIGGASSLYRTCGVNGTFGTAHQECPGAVTCLDTFTGGMRGKICGGECSPGTRDCVTLDGGPGQGALRTCLPTGQWGAATDCALGSCQFIFLPGYSGAACVAECQPGATSCVGSSVTASDGVSQGTTVSATCGADGLNPATGTTCTGTQTCRTTSNGTALGCVECIGANDPGGNNYGLIDSRCESPTHIETCTPSRAWSNPSACPNGTECLGPPPKECFGCPFYPAFPCTESELQQSGESCASFGDVAAPCGSTPDCCSSACVSPGGAPAACGTPGGGGAGGAGGAGGSAGAVSGGAGGSGPGSCNPMFCPVPPPPGSACCITPNGPCGADFGGGCS